MSPLLALFGHAEAAWRCLLMGPERTCLADLNRAFRPTDKKIL
jgi:hypothetical protein